MSTRELNMAKIAASVEDEAVLEDEASQDENLDSSLSVEDRVNAERLKQAELKTQMAINRLEKAKNAATSDAVKAKLQEEIDEAKRRKLEQAEARKTQLAEAAKTLKTVKTATDLASTGAKIGADVRGNVDNTVSKVQDTVGHVAGTLEQVSTPGGIFLPITILLIFFFLILPVNGMTRAQWLWLSIIGDAQIQASGTTTSATTNGVEDIGLGGGGTPNIPVRRVY